VLNRAYRHELNGSTLEPSAPQLEVADLSLWFGGVQALKDVSLTVRQGTIHAIIGPNGAGKTSLLNSVSGLYRPQDGSIRFRRTAQDWHELTRTKTDQIARLGVARSFQNIELFRHMSVLENIMLGRHVHLDNRLWASLLWFGPARRQEVDHRDVVEEIIDLLEIQDVRHQQVGALAYGVQKRVELGRALAMQPAVLLLDEPMAGMNAEEKEDMARFVLDVNELKGVSTVLIEHDMDVVMDISDHVTVLNFGGVIGDGTPDEVRANPAVVEAYLGEEEDR
jgi:branched-chain amino acid transport system ATP-binding protein